MAVTYTQADLDALKDALVTGASEVQIGDRKIRYRSQAELLQAMKIVEAQLTPVSTSVSTSLIQGTYRKGQSE
jgi:hypothetical protein